MKLQRRTLLMTCAAVAAAGAGAWLSWRRIAPQPVLSGAEAAFWASDFEGPNGEAVNLAAMRGRPLLVNFWATWCPPCVEELPLLNGFNTTHAAQGWQVLGLAVDQPSAVRGFLKKLPLNFPVGMAGFAGTELSKTLGNPSGSLPYTVVFGAEGTVAHRKVGKVSEADLAQWAQLG